MNGGWVFSLNTVNAIAKIVKTAVIAHSSR
jgi:hypothetical protein